MRRFILVVFFLVVYACGGGPGNGGLFAEDLTVMWDWSGYDVDGNVESGSHYILKWGDSAGNYTNAKSVNIGDANCIANPSAPMFTDCNTTLITDAPPQDYYITAQVVDMAGNTSDDAVEIMKEIIPPDITKPASAGNLR